MEMIREEKSPEKARLDSVALAGAHSKARLHHP